MVRKVLLLFFMVPGTSCGRTFQSPELVTSSASLRLALGSKEDKQALGASQRSRLGRAEGLTLGTCQPEFSYFLLKIPRTQDFQSNLLGVQPAEVPGA